MQILIEIPEEKYNTIKNKMYCGIYDAEVYESIANGTPLPKGHGRLIDADKLEPRDISPEAWYSPMWGFELIDIEDVPTIIEADTESGDKE